MSSRWIGLLLCVLWVGGSGLAHAAPNISVTPDSPPTVNVGSAREKDDATISRTFTIRNTGNGSPDLSVTAISFSSTDYRLNPVPSFPLTMTPGQSRTITVELNPSDVGARDATMTIESNDADNGNKTISITGTGTAALISVPATLDYGTVNNGVASSQNVTVRNTVTTNQGPLAVTSAAITGSTFFKFGTALGCNGGTTCTFNPPLSITGATSTVPVICQPAATATGTSTATLKFTSDTDAGGGDTVTLSCTAGRADISVSVSSLTFTNVAAGQSVTSEPVEITNNGTIDLTYSLAVAPNLSQFSIDGCVTNCSVPKATQQGPGKVTFTVTFTPTSSVPVTAQLQIANNDPDQGDGLKTIDLSGTGRQGVVATDKTTLDFGDVPQGTTKPLSFTLKNTGNVAITGLTAQLGDPDLGFQLVGTVPDTLAASGQVALSVVFAPPIGNPGGSTSITFQGNWTFNGRSDTTTAVLTLNGHGQSVGFDLSAATLNFGNFRFDSKSPLSYQITNTGQAPLTVFAPADFTPDPPTTAAEVAFVVKRNGSPIELVPPPVLAKDEHLEVEVTLLPDNRTGLVSGHVNVHTSFTTDRQVTITGNATSAAIRAPAMVDFGPVDIDGPAPSQTITLTNTGAAKLDIMSIATIAGGSTAFTVTPLPNSKTTVEPGADLNLSVTYAPTTTRPENQPETLVLDATLVGIAGSPGHAVITLQGFGIDRVLAVDAVTAFPPTFRNPGDAAPVMAVTVHNNGLALLKITGAMVADGGPADDPVWKLLDESPVDIPGGGSHDFMVRFSPKAIDDATQATPRGRLVLMSDDNGRPVANVDLAGTCVARRVAFDATKPFDVGRIGIGIPIEITLPAIANRDSVAFTIHAVDLSEGSAFQLASEIRDVALPAGATQQLTIMLDPTAPGPLATTVRVYVDQDPTPQTELTITGTAAVVEATGSGGCAAAGGSAGGAGIALGALVGFALRRRRVRPGLAAVAVVATAGIAGPARAEDRTDTIGVTVFEPTPATTGAGFQLQSPEVGAHGSWTAGSVVSYASNPFVLRDDTVGYRSAPVERSTLLQLGLAFALFDRFEIGAGLPLYMQSGQVSSGIQGVEAASGTALGKLRVHGKAQLWRGGGGLGDLAIATSAAVAVPTASSHQYTGSDRPEGQLLLLGSYVPAALGSRLAITVNGGGIMRGETTFANYAQRSAIAWGGGASYRVLDSLWATAEVFGETTPSGQVGPESGGKMPTAMLVQSEWLVGASFRGDRFTIGVAAGRGVTNTVGTPEVRGVVSLAFTQGAHAIAPIHRAEEPRPDLDSDGDGVPDSVDKCPNEPEDKDLFEDDDGCPEPDNDKDGILDALDKCPLDPEDKDGFQDEDGCPDKDNDGDGIPDTLDKCPNEPEDKDGFEDLDGCPDPDNDKDGIPDSVDKCPSEPETINGIKDDDGCPDKGDSTIVLSPDRVETLDPIPFNGVKIGRTALPLLGQVAATLRAHTEIVRVRVTVHVQPSADPDADQTRSDKRAQAVRDWLVQWGIAPSRIEARGFGGSKPLVPADKRGAAKINDRIEFIILERK